MYKIYTQKPGVLAMHIHQFLLVMRLTTLIMILGIVQASATTFGQKVTLAVKNEPLTKVFKKISQQTGYGFILSNKMMKDSKPVSVDLKEVTLSEALRILFRAQPLTYAIEEKSVVVSRKADLVSAGNTTDRFQQTDIKGRVVDEKGLPLPGVTVMVKETSKVTTTDTEGRFSFKGVSEGSVLIFKFIGFETQEVPIGRNTDFNIILKESLESLEEVVVLGFGQTQKKIAQTGSVAAVSSKELKQSPVANLTNALAGRLPGLIAQQRSGEPGKDIASLLIRGRATFNSAQPLITIDGVQKDPSAIGKLDVNEVENITILKDASATALYGVKGANGVIIITTRRGAAGPPVITAGLQSAVLAATRLPKFLRSYDYALLANEAAKNDNPLVTPPYSDVALEAYRTGSDPMRYPDIDWVHEMIKSSSLNRANFSVNGGSTTSRYFVNLGYVEQNGLYRATKQPKYDPNAQMKRYNFRSNIDMDLNKNFSLSLNLFGAIENTNASRIASDALFGYLGSVQPNAAPIRYPTGFYGRDPAMGGNPLKELNTWGFTQGFNSSLSGMLSATHKLDFITKGLFIKGNYSFDGYFLNSFTRSESVRSAFYNGTGDLKDEASYTYAGSDQALSAPVSTFSQNRDIWTDLSLNYQRAFGDHNFTGLLLANRTQKVIGGEVPYVSQGLVTRIAYDYKNKYFAEFDAGYNGTDNFAKESRYGFFPAVSAAWILSKESFLKNISMIDMLKIRGSYGLTGNDQLSGRRWLFVSQFNRGGGYQFGDPLSTLQGVQEGALANADVTWEKARKANIGLDAVFAKGLLGITLDLFQETRNDILITRNSVPSLIGVSAANLPPVNFGSVKNRGFELVLSHKHKIGELSYNVQGNVSFARNKILFMDEEAKPYDYLLRTGLPIGQLYGLTAIGFFQSQEDIDNSPQQFGKLIPGDLKYRDLNSDGIIDANDAGPIGGTAVPEIFYGASLSVQWRNLDLSCLFQGAGNVNVILNNQAAYEFWNRGNVLEQHLGRWTPETAATATYPALHYSVNTNNHRFSSFFLKDASYLRLKNVEVGYTLKFKAMKRQLGTTALRVFANAQNVYTWDKVGGTFDPEIPGGNGAVYPQQRVYNFGLSVDF
ncbi:TonB-linked SusC/RagA family outer membrane protein [Pedobacter africanus]